MKYTRRELLGIISSRHGQPEGMGAAGFLEFRVKVTPEFLEAMLGGTWIAVDGKRTTLEGVELDADGYLTPILVATVPIR